MGPRNAANGQMVKAHIDKLPGTETTVPLFEDVDRAGTKLKYRLFPVTVLNSAKALWARSSVAIRARIRPRLSFAKYES